MAATTLTTSNQRGRALPSQMEAPTQAVSCFKAVATQLGVGDNEVRAYMLDWTTCLAVERHCDRVSGACVFRGTRVPVSALFSNLEGGATVNEFLEWFPGVSREQVNIVLEHASRSLADPIPA
jgi:uncharacterized protein (DUF433 family)